MAAIAERFEQYLKKYANFQIAMNDVEHIHNKILQIEYDLKKTESEFDSEKLKRKRVKAETEETEKKLWKQQTFYEACNGKKVFDHKGKDCHSDVAFVQDEYTDPIEFENQQKKIQDRYERLEKEYYTERECKLNEQKRAFCREKERFYANKESYIQDVMQNVKAGCEKAFEDKKQEVMNYLNANSKIKNSGTAAKIRSVIEKETIEQKACGTSEQKLIENIMALESTEKYKRTQKLDMEHFKLHHDTDMYQSWFIYPFLKVSAVVLFILFMMGFTPLFFLIPSSAAVAGAGGAVIRMVIRILGAILFAAVALGAFYFVGALLGFPTIGLGLGAVAGIYVCIKFFTDYYPNITTNNMMGFGNVVHFMIAAIVNLVAVAAIVIGIECIVLNTPLANLFFSSNEDVVEQDLKKFENYFFAHKTIYLAMFDYHKAIGYACENRFQSLEDYINQKIKHISEEKEYVRMQKECGQELEKRRKEREKRLSIIREKLQMLQKEADAGRKNLFDMESRIKSLERQIGSQMKKLTDQKKNEQERMAEIAADKHYLLVQTDHILTEDSEKFEARCGEINTPLELLACKGKLSEQIYFVRHQKDQYDMAQVRKIDFKCQHTIFVYDKKDISGNNLSEELCHFIKWFTEAIRRTNPAALLYKYFTVIDVMSGQSILTMPPYNRVFDVVGSEKEKLALAETLRQKEIFVTTEMNRTDIRKESACIENVDTLNAIKMEINRPDIEQQPDIPIQELWEKLLPYHVLIFIVPRVVESGAQPSVLNDELKKVLMNADHYGIIPVFLVASDTWKDTKRSSDAAYLHNIQKKSVISILNVGKENEKLLDI